MDKIKVFIKNMPWWHLVRILCICALCIILIKPLIELKAYDSSVTFLNTKQATLAWDPPSQGTVDHYVVEVTITKLLDGPSNYVSWVEYREARDTKLTINTRHGYSYTFRVKAVGPNGNESPYSEERVTAICDRKEPVVEFNPFERELDVSAGSVELTGSFKDENLESIIVNGIKAKIDVNKKTWFVTVPVNQGLNKITVVASDYADNKKEYIFEVDKQEVHKQEVERQEVNSQEVERQEEVDNQEIDKQDIDRQDEISVDIPKQNKIIVDSIPVTGSDLFVMGTPAFPGIYVCKLPLEIQGYIDPSFTIPSAVRLKGYIGKELIATFPEGVEKIEFFMKPQRTVHAFNTIPIGLNYKAGIIGPLCPFVADYDQDNELEIILSSGSGQLFLLKDEGDGRRSLWLQTRLAQNNSSIAYGAAPFLIDFDNDLEYELAVKTGNAKLSTLELDDRTWKKGVILFEGIEGSIKSFWFLDWNKDRKKDLAVSTGSSDIIIFLNHGSDAEPAYNNKKGIRLNLSHRDPEASFAFCDWNGDGIKDVVSQKSDGELAVWLGNGHFESPSYSEKGLGVSAQNLQGTLLYPSVADWNNDGLLDIVIGTDSGRLYLLLGK